MTNKINKKFYETLFEYWKVDINEVDKKESLVKNILKCNNLFSENHLRTMHIEQLERIADYLVIT